MPRCAGDADSNVVQVSDQRRSPYLPLHNRFQDEADIGRALAEPPHEIREPLLAERHVDAHPVALGDERGLQIAPDAIQHLELVAVVARCPAPRRSCASSSMHLLVVRGDRRDTSPWSSSSAHQRDDRRRRRPPSADTRQPPAPCRRPSPAARARRARSCRSMSCSVRCRPTAARCRYCGSPAATASRRRSSVTSVYGEFSMSMRTKNPWRAGRLEDAPQVVDARSPGRRRGPSCVSFSEMLRSMPEATMASMSSQVLARRRGRPLERARRSRRGSRA